MKEKTMNGDSPANTRSNLEIPKDRLQCIWMTAGIIGYKLCNAGYECERCPFDLAMRKQAT